MTPQSQKAKAALGGVALGAFLMFLWDPNRGPRRRAMVRDKWTHYRHRGVHEVERRGRHARNRGVGFFSELRSLFTGSPRQRQARRLERRVEDRLGRKTMHMDTSCLDPLTAARMTDHNVR